MTTDHEKTRDAAPETSAIDRRRPGLLTFSLEGRSAPALFLVGWLATIVGLAVMIVGYLARPGLAGGVLFTVGLGLLSLGLVGAAGSQAIERRAAGGSPSAGPSPVIVFAASIALTIFLVVVIGTPLVLLGMDPESPPAAFVSIAITAIVYLGLVSLLVVGTGALSWREMGIVRPSPAWIEDIGWGALLAVPVLAVTGIVAALLSFVLPVQEPVLPPAPDAGGVLLNLLSAAVIAPLGEEIFFRGFATTAWSRVAGPTRALVGGAVFFAVAHILTLGATDAGQAIGVAAFAFVVRIPVALALGWLFLRRRTLVAPIALHAAFNGLQVLALAAAS